MRLRAWIAVAGAVAAFAGVAAPARAAEPSLYLASGEGYSLILKAEGRKVFATWLEARSYCRGPGSHWNETNVSESHSFSGRSVEFDRAGAHLHLEVDEGNDFESHEALMDAEIRPDGVVGYFSRHASGEGLGGGCQSGDFDGDAQVPFEAVRYVPIGSVLASTPDPAARAVYFTGSDSLEVFLGIEAGQVTEIHGSDREICAGRHTRDYLVRYPLRLDPPFALTPPDNGFDVRSSYSSREQTSSTRFVGRVGVEAVDGFLRSRSASKDHGRPSFWCRAGKRGERGYARYHAVRFVPLA